MVATNTTTVTKRFVTLAGTDMPLLLSFVTQLKSD